LLVPDWVDNRLVVSGEPMALAHFREQVKGRDDDGVELMLDFERIRPVPRVLHEGGKFSDTAEARELAEEYHRVGAFGTEEERLSLVDKSLALSALIPEVAEAFGLADEERGDAVRFWRDCAWGTKWNLANERVGMEEAEDGCSLTFFFATAWSPPLPLIDFLAARRPDLEFELAYVSPHAFAGHRHYASGALIGSGEEGQDADAVSILRRAGWHEAADELAEWLAESEAQDAESG
jgi:hypothetical protein